MMQPLFIVKLADADNGVLLSVVFDAFRMAEIKACREAVCTVEEQACAYPDLLILFSDGKRTRRLDANIRQRDRCFGALALKCTVRVRHFGYCSCSMYQQIPRYWLHTVPTPFLSRPTGRRKDLACAQMTDNLSAVIDSAFPSE